MAHAMISHELIAEVAQCQDEGTIYELSLHNQKLHAMCGLGSCVRLRVLDLSFNNIRTIEGLETLGDLRELKLYANMITHVSGLDCVLKLQTLLLHDNRLGPSSAVGTALTRLSQLETLRLDCNPLLTSDGLQQLRLLELPSLIELNASSLQLHSTEALLGLRKLATLELNHNNLSSLGAVARLTTLQVLPGRSILASPCMAFISRCT